MRKKQVVQQSSASSESESEQPSASETGSEEESCKGSLREPVVEAPKSKLSDAKLEQLRLAREKALLARKRIGDVRRKEKELREKALQQRMARIELLEADLARKAAPKKKKARPAKAPAPKPDDSESSASSSSEDEVDYKAKYRRLKAKAKAPPQDPTKLALLDQINKRVHAMAYGSLFPGAGNNPYV